MSETSSNTGKYVAIFLLLSFILLALFLAPSFVSQAQQASPSTTAQPANFSASLTGGTLCSAGLGCEEINQQSSQPVSLFPDFAALFSPQGPNYDPVISVVNIPGQRDVYRIINGRKHAIPTEEIFYSYGFDLDIVQDVTRTELDKYPVARLFTLENSSEDTPTVFYLTESGMLRPILNDKVFYSYGNRKEDIITINQKEFNHYPKNQFVYVERPEINREIYQITGGLKRYLTPVAVQRMNLKESEIAPINQIEFDEYPSGESIIF